MKTISISWSTQDVLMLADEMDVQLTEAQADEVLDRLVENHDADIGINWGVIEYHIEDLLAEYGKENN
jgi:acyl-homoserine lactone acylase PvdQ